MSEQQTQSEAPIAGDRLLRVLIIDDDIKFCRFTSNYLSRYGFEVTLAHSGIEAMQKTTGSDWDAIILDVMLPVMDGYEVLRKIRAHSDVPILMLTALGDDENDRIVGLEIGADDYLPKTFSPRELLARLRAVLRRTSFRQAAATAANEISANGLHIDLSSRQATIDSEPVVLTPIEFDLLVVLARSRGRIKTREQLLNEIRETHFDVADRSIDVHIFGLRKKLRDDARNPRFIRTVRTAGYMFMATED